MKLARSDFFTQVNILILCTHWIVKIILNCNLKCTYVSKSYPVLVSTHLLCSKLLSYPMFHPSVPRFHKRYLTRPLNLSIPLEKKPFDISGFLFIFFIFIEGFWTWQPISSRNLNIVKCKKRYITTEAFIAIT